MALTVSHILLLERENDVYLACERVAALATEVGFDRYANADIETAVAEICSNSLRHAEGGWMAIRNAGTRLEVAVTDRGPGFAGPQRLSPGLGIGLEGARRLMDELSIANNPNGSTVTMSRQLPDRNPADSHSAWSTAAAFRIKRGKPTSGDSMIARVGPDGTLRVALADGLGSGEEAAAAAQHVLRQVVSASDDSPSSALVSADHASRDTRGAVVAVADISRDGRGIHASVGDVSCQLSVSTTPLLTRPGIVGAGNGDPADTHFRLPAETAVVFWTDGIRPPDSTWVGSLPAAGHETAWLEEATLQHGDSTDDGAIVLVRRRR